MPLLREKKVMLICSDLTALQVQYWRKKADEKQSIQVLEDLLVEHTIKLKSYIKQISDEEQCTAVVLLRNLVHILSLRVQELRGSKYQEKWPLQNLRKCQGRP